MIFDDFLYPMPIKVWDFKYIAEEKLSPYGKTQVQWDTADLFDDPQMLKWKYASMVAIKKIEVIQLLKWWFFRGYAL